MVISNMELMHGLGKRNTACSTCKGKKCDAPPGLRHNSIQTEKLLAIEQVQFVETAVDRTDYATGTMSACLGHEPTIVDEPS
jgi:hypothetical protein